MKIECSFTGVFASTLSLWFSHRLISLFEMSMNENGRFQEDDIIILVLGLTGAGKSKFINTAIGEPRTRTSKGMASCTYEVEKFEVPRSSESSPHRIFLVDTPGFDHTYMEESEVFDRIANWLKDVHVKIAGIIFLHDIAHDNYSSLNSAIRIVQRRLLGSHPLNNVILATANWSDIEPGERQKQIANTEWGNLISQGARDDQFLNTEESARAIIESIAQQPWKEPLLIQRDIGVPRVCSSSTNSPTATMSSKRPDKHGIEAAGDVTLAKDQWRVDDIIIPVMGRTGVGKSTLVNDAAGKKVVTVGHGMKSCTADIQHVFCECPGDPSRRVVLVDTPGSDDTYKSDEEVLRRIAVWLASSYGQDMKLAGILYLHDITQSRMSGTMLRDLDVFRKLCGEDAEKNVVLVTTKWANLITANVGQAREQELTSVFWKEMMAHGSTTTRFDRSHLWDVMRPILANKTVVDALQIQRELVDWGRKIPETDAGKALASKVKKLEVSHGKAIEGFKHNTEDGTQLKEIEKEARELLKQLEEGTCQQ
ncbi:P-loop containing nucleoside triphosphate hydrolase protein [Suillus subluteus]|nr:P-loop containing nucleoside triphosphate hydrolase protein [Suillus subluteus]